MLLGFIGLYLLGTLAIGYWASKKVKNTNDFVVAGRNLPLMLASTALFATWFGSETIMGSSSEFVEHGLIGVVEDPFGAALCLILVGLFFARPLYRLNILTFNDYFRLRYGRREEIISAFFMVPSYFGWIAAQLVAMAIILQALMGTSLITGIVLCTIFVVFYTYIGGMWAVSITDFVQTIMIVLGLLFLAIQLTDEIGGLDKVIAATPEGFFNFLPESDLVSVLTYFSAWITIGLGSIPQQDVFQRTMSAKNEQTAVRAAYLGSLLYLSIGMIPLFIGLCNNILYPVSSNEDAQMILPNMVLQHGGIGLQILFFGALLSAILSTTSGAILAPATVMGENILKPYFSHWNDEQLLQSMRYSIIGIAIVSAGMAMWKSNIYELVAQSSALSLVSLFVPLTAGLYWKAANERGALLSMLLGMAVWLPCEIIETEIPALLYGLLASFIGMLVGTYWKISKSSSKMENPSI